MIKTIDKTKFELPSKESKFVQIYVASNGERAPILVTADSMCPHRLLFSLALDKINIRYEKIALSSGDGPDSRNEDGSYEAVGMGWAKFDEGNNTLYLYRKSEDYGLTPNEAHAQELSNCLEGKLKITVL